MYRSLDRYSCQQFYGTVSNYYVNSLLTEGTILVQLLNKLQEKWSTSNKQPYSAMYSSVFAGITLDPALMVIPIDDHMVHRGHGVFDTARIVNGYLYELDRHLDRFMRSVSLAKVSSPFPQSTLRSILVQLVAISQRKNGSLKYWLSAGPGDFLLSPSGCPTPSFYAIVIDDDNNSKCKEGAKVITSTIPMKPPLFATSKNVNHLPNVLSKMLAEEKGAFASVWIDDEGHIAEGSNLNVAFIGKDKELLLPLHSTKYSVGASSVASSFDTNMDSTVSS